MFGRSGGESAAAAAAEGEPGTHFSCPGPAGGEASARGGGMPGEGCWAPAPRSPDREEGNAGSEGGTAGTRESHTGHTSNDCTRNMDRSNRSTGGRRGTSLNGHRRAHRHRDSRNGDSGHRGICSSVSVPLERLTQGRTGVVKLARTEPHRREAWSIFPQGMDPRVRPERGEGHRFDYKPVTQDWCDACSRQITARALKCQNCSYTCHLECESQVQLDCNQRDREPEETPSPTSHCSSTVPQHRVSISKTNDISLSEIRLEKRPWGAICAIFRGTVCAEHCIS